MSISKTACLNRLFITLIAIAVALLTQNLAVFRMVDGWMNDSVQRLTAKERYYDDIIVVDIDDESLQVLRNDIGEWPYNRAVYAAVVEYLEQMEVEAVVFDIIFSQANEGDTDFAAALRRPQNVFLAASPTDHLDSRLDATPGYSEILAAQAWEIQGDLPSFHLSTLELPRSEFFDVDGGRIEIGVTASHPDSDGVWRRLPVVYDAGRHHIPSLPVALARTVNAEKEIKLSDMAPRSVELGHISIPFDDDGMFHISFPRNANSVLRMPFHRLYRAMAEEKSDKSVAEFLRGKTIMIGSSASHANFVNTPRGQMSGTYFLAHAYQSLKHGYILNPAYPYTKAILLGSVLLVLALIGLWKPHGVQAIAIATLTGGITILGVNAALTGFLLQVGSILAPLLALLTAGAMHAVYSGRSLFGFSRELSGKAQELSEENEKLAVAASTDALTGLLNRRAFSSSFERDAALSDRLGTAMSIAVLDIDFFKRINDTYGHDAGDAVLKEFASLLMRCKRKVDTVARWGGEEFVVLLGNACVDDAAAVLERIRNEVSKTDFPGIPDGVTVSIGVAEAGHEFELEHYIGLADGALYEAKEGGRNQVRVYKEKKAVA